ncbi:MAG: glycerate kinase type-2 family protein [Candidatus Binataceae bacterium]
MSEVEQRPSPRSRARADLIRIYAAAVAAVEPGRAVARAFEGASAVPTGVAKNAGDATDIAAMIAGVAGVRLLAVGKAAPGMAAEVERRLGDKLIEGLRIVPKAAATESPCRDAETASPAPAARVRIAYASHPLPDEASAAAGRAALEFAARTRPGELFLVALSGGASALMVAPADGVTLADKVAVTAALMRAGATIRELNIVRKHLSAVKGGGLLRAVDSNVRVLLLVLSDVPGNDLATIGSGPVTADPTTFGDAIAVLKRRGLWGRAPESVRDRLERGTAGEIHETLKSNDAALARVTSVIVGDNRAAVDAAAHAAARLGYAVERGRGLAGEADDAGRALAASLCAFTRERVCVVTGGEPVVTVRGPGRGGRAQQCALAMAAELARIGAGRRVMALFGGTDGIDGPTDAAGAIVMPDTIARAAEAGIDAAAALGRNDSYNVFKALGDLLVIGPTGTNVADVFAGLVNF